MAESPAEIIQAYLVEEGLFQSPGTKNTVWPCFVGGFPDAPDDGAVVMDSTVEKDGRLMMAGRVIIHPRVQVLVRSREYTSGYAKAKLVFDLLEAVKKTEVEVDSNTHVLANASPVSGITPLGQEQETTKRRWMFSVNFQLTLQQ